MLTRSINSYFYLFSLFGLSSFSISKNATTFKQTHLRLFTSCIYCFLTISIGLGTYIKVIQYHMDQIQYKSDVNQKNDLCYITLYHLSYYSLMISSVINANRHMKFLNKLQLIDKQIFHVIDRKYFPPSAEIKINHRLIATITTVFLYRISIEFLRNLLPIICRIWLIWPLFTQGLVIFYMSYLTTVQVHHCVGVYKYFNKLISSPLCCASMSYKHFCDILYLIYDCQNLFRIFGKTFCWYFMVIELNNFALLMNGIFSCIVYYRYEFNYWWLLYMLSKIPIVIIFLDLRSCLDKLAQQVIIFLFFIFNDFLILN